MKSIGLIYLALCVTCTVCDIKFDKKSYGVARIVGGNDAETGQIPYQASIRVLHNQEHNCGASIISNRFILTAAHCTRGLYLVPRFVYVVIGSNHLNDGISINVDKITPHEHFDKDTLCNDISLLRTTKEIVFTDSIQPIALPTRNTAGNIEVIISGWGRTEYPPPTGKPALSDNLQFGKSMTITFDDCKEHFKNHTLLEYLNEDMLCTINELNVATCFGDSGGPLVDVSNPEKKTLAGIISWGIPCGVGYPDVFTRVYTFLDWIEEKMAEQS